MINGKRIAVVMPAYNAEKTLENTVAELSDVVDIKILVDDSSKTRPPLFPEISACRRLSMMPITAMAATSRRVIARRLPRAPTSWSWSIPTTSTRRGWSRQWRE